MLLVDDGKLVELLDDDEEALAEAMKKPGVESSEKKKKKKEKDPNAPAGKMSAYTFFMADHRNDLRNNNPEASFSDISKMIGQKWRTLDPKEKAKYDEKAVNDKIRFTKAMEEYKVNGRSASHDEGEAMGSNKKRKKDKDPNAPKSARNRYVLFCSEMRSKIKAENPGLDGKELNAKVNEAYSNLSPDDVDKYDKMAEADKKRFSEEMKEYEAGKSNTPKVVPDEDEDEDEITEDEIEVDAKDEDDDKDEDDVKDEVNDKDEDEDDDDEEEEEEEEIVPKTVAKAKAKAGRSTLQKKRIEEDDDDDDNEIEEEAKEVPRKKSSSSRERRATRTRSKVQNPETPSSLKKKKGKKRKKSMSKKSSSSK